MKTFILACAFAAVLGMGGLADACQKGHHHSKGISGKITGVGKKSFTMALGGNANQVVTVNYGTGSTITGTVHGTIDSAVIGHVASVVGATNGSTINASHIAISAGHHGRRAA